MKKIMIVLAVALLASCSEDKQDATEASQVAPPPAQAADQGSKNLAANRIKPEDLVRFESGTLACVERDNLQQIVDHVLKGEKTKAAAMMVDQGGDCLMLPPTKTLKVIHSEYNATDSNIGLLEIVGKDTVSPHGAWAFSVGAQVVKE